MLGRQPNHQDLTRPVGLEELRTVDEFRRRDFRSAPTLREFDGQRIDSRPDGRDAKLGTNRPACVGEGNFVHRTNRELARERVCLE